MYEPVCTRQSKKEVKDAITSTFSSLNKYVIFIAIASQMSVFFTAARIVRTQNSVGLSVMSTFISLGLSVVWLLHGLFNNRIGSVVTSSIAILGNIIVLFLIYKYRDPSTDNYNFPTISEREKDANGDIIIKEYRPEVYAGHNSGFVIIKSS